MRKKVSHHYYLVLLIILIISVGISGCQSNNCIGSIELDENYLEIFPYPELESRGHVGIIPSMSSENTIAFLNKDGTKTLYVYAAPIQNYIKNDENNGVTFTLIDNRIIENTDRMREKGYIYKNAVNDIEVYFPKNTFDTRGILLCDNDFMFEISPLSNAVVMPTEYLEKENIIGDIKPMIKYSNNDLGINTYLYPSNTGLNMELEATGTSDKCDVQFMLDITSPNEANLKIQPNGYATISIENAIKAVIQSPVLKNKDGNISYDSEISYKYVEKNKYLVTLSLEDDYINSGSKAYCSFEMRREKSNDNTIYSGMPELNNNHLANFSVIGNSDCYGIGRNMIRFNFTKNYNLVSDDIISAQYFVYNMTGGGATSNFELVDILDEWSSSLGNWNKNYNFGETVSFSNAADSVITFDITEKAKMWCADETGLSEINGLMMKASDETNMQSYVLSTNDNNLFNNVLVIHLK